MVEVIYHAALKRGIQSPRGILTTKIEYHPGVTPKKISEDLGLEEVGIVMVNGKLARENELIANGDTVAFHPFIGGG